MATNERKIIAALLFILALPVHAQPKIDLPPPPPLAQPSRVPDVIFVPTPPAVVGAMLKAAGVTGRDMIYDLGCGDGRILIEAARTYGARGVGVDLDPERIEEAQANARRAGVQNQVQFRLGDLFEIDLGPATVVTLYLLPRLNMQLRPKLLKLKSGTRIVSHAFDMGDWTPDRVIEVDGRTVYLWRVP